MFLVFQDGAIRGLNVAQMIRSLTAGTLSGWQEEKEQATDLSQLSASFRIERGKATTTDLNLVGPLVRVTGAGTIDLGTKMLGFRVEPKLVMTTEGQGRTTDPVGLGIPVVIDGPWAEPRIYPDMAGMLDNPDAAYAKLKEMGKGLFGAERRRLGGLGRQFAGGNQPGRQPPMDRRRRRPVRPARRQARRDAGQSDPAGAGPAAGRQPAARMSRTPDAAAASRDPAAAGARARATPPQTAPQDSQPMNDVLRQLFNRSPN